MIYLACGGIMFAVGITWLFIPSKTPNRMYGYLSYLAVTNKESFKLAQKWGRNYFILFGLIQMVLGYFIYRLNWDKYFIIWLLTFYLFIIAPLMIVETKLQNYLREHHQLPHDYVKLDEIKKKKIKGFKDK